MEIPTTTVAIKLRASGAAMSAAAAVLTLTIAAAPALGQAHNPPPTTPYLEGTSVMSTKDDLANRSLDIHWPAGFTPDDADLFSPGGRRGRHAPAPGHDLWLATLKWVSESK
jgi:hypothetical protein